MIRQKRLFMFYLLFYPLTSVRPRSRSCTKHGRAWGPETAALGRHCHIPGRAGCEGQGHSPEGQDWDTHTVPRDWDTALACAGTAGPRAQLTGLAAHRAGAAQLTKARRNGAQMPLTEKSINAPQNASTSRKI